jgi:hypothetical protein
MPPLGGRAHATEARRGGENRRGQALFSLGLEPEPPDVAPDPSAFLEPDSPEVEEPAPEAVDLSGESALPPFEAPALARESVR